MSDNTIVFNFKNVKTGKDIRNTETEKQLIEYSEQLFKNKCLLDLIEQAKHAKKTADDNRLLNNINELKRLVNNTLVLKKMTKAERLALIKTIDDIN